MDNVFPMGVKETPLIMIEAKLAESTPSLSLKKFQTQLNIPVLQLIREGDTYRVILNHSQKILVAPAYQRLAGL